jgi:hypothetical protein
MVQNCDSDQFGARRHRTSNAFGRSRISASLRNKAQRMRSTAQPSIARGIPNARFVALDSRNQLILSREPAWPRFNH